MIDFWIFAFSVMRMALSQTGRVSLVVPEGQAGNG
jgi:hypothetical protein